MQASFTLGFGVTGGVIGSGPATRPGLGPRPEDVETTRLRSILFRPTNFFGDRLRSSSDSDSVRFPIFCTNTKTASISHFLHQKQLPFSQFLHKKQLSFSHFVYQENSHFPILCTKTPTFYAPKNSYFLHATKTTPIFSFSAQGNLPFLHFMHQKTTWFYAPKPNPIFPYYAPKITPIFGTKNNLHFLHETQLPFSHCLYTKTNYHSQFSAW